MHAVNGFELPTVDLDRAATFYEKVLELSLRREVFLGVPHAIFPSEDRSVGGALVKSENHSPSAKGTVVYLNAKDIDGCLARVASAGGSIAVPKTRK